MITFTAKARFRGAEERLGYFTGWTSLVTVQSGAKARKIQLSGNIESAFYQHEPGRWHATYKPLPNTKMLDDMDERYIAERTSDVEALIVYACNVLEELPNHLRSQSTAGKNPTYAFARDGFNTHQHHAIQQSGLLWVAQVSRKLTTQPSQQTTRTARIIYTPMGGKPKR